MGRKGSGIHRQLPHLGSKGAGIHRQLPIEAWFAALSERLARVRFCCGDWARVVTPSVTTGHGLTGVFLDPPYPCADVVYDMVTDGVSDAATEWAFENGQNPKLRIVLCGYERKVPKGWRSVPCENRAGYARANGAARKIERLMLSPHCL